MCLLVAAILVFAFPGHVSVAAILVLAFPSHVSVAAILVLAFPGNVSVAAILVLAFPSHVSVGCRHFTSLPPWLVCVCCRYFQFLLAFPFSKLLFLIICTVLPCSVFWRGGEQQLSHFYITLSTHKLNIIGTIL
jgi:hypothetical protein